MNKVAYICDRKKACNGSLLCGTLCTKTRDVEHAKNFEITHGTGGVKVYREKESGFVPGVQYNVEPKTMIEAMDRLRDAWQKLKAEVAEAMKGALK